MSLNTKFADMPAGIQTQWRTWANSHDWGQRNPARTTAEGMHVECVEIAADGKQTIVPFVARTPKELRDWAGY